MIAAVLLLLPIVGAVVTCIAARRSEDLRDNIYRVETFLVMVLSVVAFILQVNGKTTIMTVGGICGFGLNLRLDGFRSLYVLIASFMWFMTGLLSREYFAHYHNRTRYYLFNQLTLLGTLGIFMSDDLYTTFIFFEIMSLSSYPWVAHDENDGAMSAASTYLIIAVFGGMVTLMGMFMMYTRIGSLGFEALSAARGQAGTALPSALILVGFAAKAGLFPLYMWLPQAHPVAPAPASALLSGVLTKTGVFGMLVISLRVMLHNEVFGNIMLALGLTTMLLGALLALFSTNLKRILACSSMSQIGYITVGIAMAVLLGHEGHVPVSGAIMHMINHSILKLTLFMAAGVIYMNLHKLELNDIRGFGIGKPLLKAAFLLGSVGLAGVPLFNGYLGKTLIHEGILEYAEELGHFGIYNICEWIFLFAAGITSAYMLKIYIALFHQKHPKRQKEFDRLNGCYMNKHSAFALTCAMVLIPILGVFPPILEAVSRMCEGFTGIEGVEGIAFFSFGNLRGGAISLLIGTLVYIFVVRKLLWSPKQGYKAIGGKKIKWAELSIVIAFKKIVDLLCCCVDNIIENRFLLKKVPRAAALVSNFADEIVDNPFILQTVPNTITAVTRGTAGITDGIVLGARKTIFHAQLGHTYRKHSLYFLWCRIAGTIFNVFEAVYLLLNRGSTQSRSKVDFVYVLAARVYDKDPEVRRATRTVSFALLLIAIGLLAVLLYLLF